MRTVVKTQSGYFIDRQDIINGVVALDTFKGGNFEVDGMKVAIVSTHKEKDEDGKTQKVVIIKSEKVA